MIGCFLCSFSSVSNNTSEDTKTMVAMETQPAVEPVKAEVSPDTGRRAEARVETAEARVETAEARVETRDVEGEMEVGRRGGEGRRKGGLCL